MAPRSRSILGFAITTSLVYLACVLAWSFVSTPYLACFRTASGTILGGFQGTETTFGPAAQPSPERDTQVLIALPHSEYDVTISARRIGYLPATLLLALVVSTPLTIRKRATSLLLAMVALHVLIVLQLAITLACYSNNTGLIPLAPRVGSVLNAAVMAIYNTNLPLMGPLFIWILTTLIRTDWFSPAEAKRGHR